MANKSGNSSTKLREFLSKTSQGGSYLVGGGSLLIILITVVFGILPAAGSTFAKLSTNTQDAELLDKVRTKEQSLGNLGLQISEKADVIDYLKDRFPDKVNEAQVIRIFNNFALQSGVLITNTQFVNFELRRSPSREYNTNQRVKGKYVDIVVQGNRLNIQKFIGEVENSKRIMNVKNFTIQAKDNRVAPVSGQAQSYLLNMRLEVYYWDQGIIIN